MIGIATAMKPALLIADEPTTAIDAITQYEILNELLHIKENHNTAMIFISHDLNAISRVADRIVVLNHGAVVDRGDFRHILHHAPPGILHKALSFVPPAHGGMLQRIMIGIATAMKPALLIADEPTTAIDAITQYEILNELLHIKENHNTAMIFISHDLNAISRVADRIVVLNHGAVVDRGDFRHILHHAQDPYTKLLVEKRADVMRRYTAVLNGKKEAAHA